MLDIIHAIKLATEFVGDMDDKAFLADAKTQAAVTRQIEIIGEAAKRLSKEFRAAHPDIPLREVAGMRDRVIHQYERVDVRRVWAVVTRDLPALMAKLEPLVPEGPT